MRRLSDTPAAPWSVPAIVIVLHASADMSHSWAAVNVQSASQASAVVAVEQARPLASVPELPSVCAQAAGLSRHKALAVPASPPATGVMHWLSVYSVTMEPTPVSAHTVSVHTPLGQAAYSVATWGVGSQYELEERGRSQGGGRKSQANEMVRRS